MMDVIPCSYHCGEDKMRWVGWLLAGVGIFLIADALLAIVFGKRYMVWGLEYTPPVYREFITWLSALPAWIVLGIKIAECLAGVVLFFIALNYR
jgi:hypothetical protein